MKLLITRAILIVAMECIYQTKTMFTQSLGEEGVLATLTTPLWLGTSRYAMLDVLCIYFQNVFINKATDCRDPFRATAQGADCGCFDISSIQQYSCDLYIRPTIECCTCVTYQLSPL